MLSKLRLFAFFAILLVVLPVFGQGNENLLDNPGFETPFSSRAGDPAPLVAESWQPWHIDRNPATDDEWRNRPPVYEPAAPESVSIDDSNRDNFRVRSGSNAQLYYNNTFWAHDGGVYQQVSGIASGTELRFSVYAYIWSSTFDDREISENPGDVAIQVGIDPSGGENPESPNIEWSIPISNQYDAYREYSIITTATSDTVTVWVRSTVGFPALNTYIYLDDAVLAETVSNVVFTSTPQPTATDGDDGGIIATSTTAPTNTTQPTATTAATNTQAPTNTIAPTNTLPSTNTDQPAPTQDPEDDPTPTREGVTNTPVATNTPLPTGTQAPTSIPQATATEAIVTDVPANTPLPTNTPIQVGPGDDDDGESVNFLNTLNHTVRRGDTVGRISALYGSTIEAINQVNELGEENIIFVGQTLIVPIPLAAPATSTPSPTPIPSSTPIPSNTPEIIYDEQPQPDQIIAQTPGTTYVVRPGDTLGRIANRFNTTVRALAQANRITNVNLIFTGQILTIPGTTSPQPPQQTQAAADPEIYVVQPGDSLYLISIRFGVPITRLSVINGITNYNLIFIGQTLIIP
jgi:LysM repeat protein